MASPDFLGRLESSPVMYSAGMTALPGLVERGGEGLDEGLESLEEAVDQLGRDLGLGEHLFESKLVSPFHDRSPIRATPSWKPMIQERLGLNQA